MAGWCQLYYKALDKQGPISRKNLVSALSVRDVLVPYLSAWIAEDEDLQGWQRVLLNGALSYEHVRIGFMAMVDDGSANAVAAGANWAAFRTAIDVVEVLKRLAAGLELTPDLCVEGYVAMNRNDDGAVRGFGLGERSLERLRKGDQELLSILENRAA